MSRTIEYSQKIANTICDELAAGKSLRTVCLGKTMPSVATVLRWVRDNAEFRQAYGEACDARAEYLACEVIDIADGKGKNISRDRLRVEARKWMLPRLAPKKYGDKLAVEASGPDGGPVQVEITDKDRAKALAALMAKLQAKTAIKGAVKTS